MKERFFRKRGFVKTGFFFTFQITVTDTNPFIPRYDLFDNSIQVRTGPNGTGTLLSAAQVQLSRVDDVTGKLSTEYGLSLYDRIRISDGGYVGQKLFVSGTFYGNIIRGEHTNSLERRVPTPLTGRGLVIPYLPIGGLVDDANFQNLLRFVRGNNRTQIIIAVSAKTATGYNTASKISVGHGPTTWGSPNAVVKTCIQKLQAAGALVLGYVDQNYGAVISATLYDAIDTWVDDYPVDGLFVDNAVGDLLSSHLSYSTDVANYARESGLYPVVGSFNGADPDQSYFDENCYDLFLQNKALPNVYTDAVSQNLGSNVWTNNRLGKSGILAHSVAAPSSTQVRSMLNSFGYFYSTSRTSGEVWGTVSEHTERILREIQPAIRGEGYVANGFQIGDMKWSVSPAAAPGWLPAGTGPRLTSEFPELYDIYFMGDLSDSPGATHLGDIYARAIKEGLNLDIYTLYGKTYLTDSVDNGGTYFFPAPPSPKELFDIGAFSNLIEAGLFLREMTGTGGRGNRSIMRDHLETHGHELKDATSNLNISVAGKMAAPALGDDAYFLSDTGDPFFATGTPVLDGEGAETPTSWHHTMPFSVGAYLFVKAFDIQFTGEPLDGVEKVFEGTIDHSVGTNFMSKTASDRFGSYTRRGFNPILITHNLNADLTKLEFEVYVKNSGTNEYRRIGNDSTDPVFEEYVAGAVTLDAAMTAARKSKTTGYNLVTSYNNWSAADAVVTSSDPLNAHYLVLGEAPIPYYSLFSSDGAGTTSWKVIVRKRNKVRSYQTPYYEFYKPNAADIEVLLPDPNTFDFPITYVREGTSSKAVTFKIPTGFDGIDQAVYPMSSSSGGYNYYGATNNLALKNTQAYVSFVPVETLTGRKIKVAVMNIDWTKLSDPQSDVNLVTKGYLNSQLVKTNLDSIQRSAIEWKDTPVSYAQYESIVRNGIPYRSKVNGNVGHDPVLDLAGAYWEATGGRGFPRFAVGTANVTANKFVYMAATGIQHADNSLEASSYAIGVATGSGVTGDLVLVQNGDLLKGFSTGMPQGAPIYLGTNGGYVTDPNTIAVGSHRVLVGYAMNATDLMIILGEPIQMISNNTVKIGVGRSFIHVGTVGTIPGNAILLDGVDRSRGGFADLHALWGTANGVGDGSTTFGVPDWQSMNPKDSSGNVLGYWVVQAFPDALILANDYQSLQYPKDELLVSRTDLSTLPQFPDGVATLRYEKFVSAPSVYGITNAGTALSSFSTVNGQLVAVNTGTASIIRVTSGDPRNKIFAAFVMSKNAIQVNMNNDGGFNKLIDLVPYQWTLISTIFDGTGSGVYADIEFATATTLYIAGMYLGDGSYDANTYVRDEVVGSLRKFIPQTGLIRTTGPFGYAFDARYGGLKSTDETELPLGNVEFTVAIPFRRPNAVTDATGRAMVQWGNNVIGQMANIYWNNNYIYLDKFGGGPAAPATAYCDNKWHMLLVTYDKTTAIFYIDDTNVKVGAAALAPVANGRGLLIGHPDAVVGTAAFQGDLGKAMIWKRVLARQEITAVSKLPPPVDCAPSIPPVPESPGAKNIILAASFADLTCPPDVTADYSKGVNQWSGITLPVGGTLTQVDSGYRLDFSYSGVGQYVKFPTGAMAAGKQIFVRAKRNDGPLINTDLTIDVQGVVQIKRPMPEAEVWYTFGIDLGTNVISSNGINLWLSTSAEGNPYTLSFEIFWVGSPGYGPSIFDFSRRLELLNYNVVASRGKYGRNALFNGRAFVKTSRMKAYEFDAASWFVVSTMIKPEVVTWEQRIINVMRDDGAVINWRIQLAANGAGLRINSTTIALTIPTTRFRLTVEFRSGYADVWFDTVYQGRFSVSFGTLGASASSLIVGSDATFVENLYAEMDDLFIWNRQSLSPANRSWLDVNNPFSSLYNDVNESSRTARVTQIREKIAGGGIKFLKEDGTLLGTLNSNGKLDLIDHITALGRFISQIPLERSGFAAGVASYDIADAQACVYEISIRTNPNPAGSAQYQVMSVYHLYASIVYLGGAVKKNMEFVKVSGTIDTSGPGGFNLSGTFLATSGGAEIGSAVPTTDLTSTIRFKISGLNTTSNLYESVLVKRLV